MNAPSAYHVQQNVATCEPTHCTDFKFRDIISKRRIHCIAVCKYNSFKYFSEGDGFGKSGTMENNKKKHIKTAKIIDPLHYPIMR